MTSARKPILLTVVAALVIAAAGWFLLISPKKAAAADLETQTVKEVSGQPALRTQLALLTADEKHAAVYRAALGELKRYMPDDASQPALFRQLAAAATAANVSLASITPGLPGAAPQAAPVPKPSTSGDTGATAAATPTAAAAPAAAPPVTAAAGLTQIALSLSVTGTYSEIKDFLNRITKFRRAFLVTSVGLTVAPPTPVTAPPAGAAAAPAAPPSYSGRLVAAVSGMVFSTGAPNVVGTIEPSLAPTPAVTPTVSATPTRRSK